MAMALMPRPQAADSNTYVAFLPGLQAMIKRLHLQFRFVCAPAARPTRQSLVGSRTDTYGQWAFSRIAPLLQTKAARVAGREGGGLRSLGTAAACTFEESWKLLVRGLRRLAAKRTTWDIWGIHLKELKQLGDYSRRANVLRRRWHNLGEDLKPFKSRREQVQD